MTPFVIYGTERTGTTLLVSLLDSHPDVLCIGEAFAPHPENIAHPELSYRAWSSRSPRRRLTSVIRPSRSVDLYLESLFTESGYAAAGFKFHHHHARRHPRVLVFAKTRRVRMIRVTRRNLLKKHVSQVTARKRKLYATRDPVDAVKIRLDETHLLQDLARLEDEERRIDASLQGLDVTGVVYEQLSADPEAETARVLRELGVDESIAVHTPWRKINPDRLDHVIENYDQIARILEGSPYRAFLDR